MKDTKHIMASDNLAANQYLRPEFAALIEKGDGTMTKLGSAHEQFRRAHQLMRDAYSKRDPAKTQEAHFMHVRDLGMKSIKSAAKRADEAEAAAIAEITTTRTAMRSQLGLVEDHRAGEIRSMLRSMKQSERDAILQEAIATGDAKTIAAVVEAPAYLSGVKADRIKSLRGQYEAQHGGDYPARIAALEKAVAINRSTAEDALKFHGKLFPADRVAEIEAKQAASRELLERLAS